jgi:hypothetical protein
MDEQAGGAVYDKVVANNPSFGENTTRLQVRERAPPTLG